MNNILSYYGIVDARISPSEKDLPVLWLMYFDNKKMSQTFKVQAIRYQWNSGFLYAHETAYKFAIFQLSAHRKIFDDDKSHKLEIRSDKLDVVNASFPHKYCSSFSFCHLNQPSKVNLISEFL